MGCSNCRAQNIVEKLLYELAPPRTDGIPQYKYIDLGRTSSVNRLQQNIDFRQSSPTRDNDTSDLHSQDESRNRKARRDFYFSPTETRKIMRVSFPKDKSAMLRRSAP